MADSPELFGGPPAVDQTGNLTVWWVPAISDLAAPKAATEIGAATAYRVTYSFVPGGWTPDGTQEKLADDRLTSPQSRESLGKTTRTLSLEYVDSTTAGSGAVVLVEGQTGFLVERRNIPQTTLAAAAQKVITYSVTLGAQISTTPDGTGKFRIKQETAVGSVTKGVLAV